MLISASRRTDLPAFIELARRYGGERLVWRYDPILFTERYDFNYHIRAFSRLCGLLCGSTSRCVVSFVVPYRSIARENAKRRYYYTGRKTACALN